MDALARGASRLWVCASCRLSLLNRSSRHARLGRGLQNSPRIPTRTKHTKAHIAQPGSQANPLSGFNAELLSKPLSETSQASRTSPTPPQPESLPKTDKEERLEKARIVFGSRLAGPAERRADIERASQRIAGVLVPPRPTEPDNCCMSGCVNCVWDVYRDELEEWAARSAEARDRLLAQRQSQGSSTTGMARQPDMPSHVATSMDDDGGGSETNWNTGLEFSGGKGDLFEGIPVGIREFMKTEKMLKNRHSAEQQRV